MKFTIPISIESIRKSAGTYWEYTNGKKRRNSILYVVTGVLALIAVFLVRDYKPWHYMYGTLGAVLFITYAPYLFMLKSHKAKYIKQVEETNGFFGEMIIEFTDENVSHWTAMYDSRISWKLVKSYAIVDGILILNYYKAALLMIDKNNLSETDFNAIVSFVKTKVSLAKKTGL